MKMKANFFHKLMQELHCFWLLSSQLFSSEFTLYIDIYNKII